MKTCSNISIAHSLPSESAPRLSAPVLARTASGERSLSSLGVSRRRRISSPMDDSAAAVRSIRIDSGRQLSKSTAAAIAQLLYARAVVDSAAEDDEGFEKGDEEAIKED